MNINSDQIPPIEEDLLGRAAIAKEIFHGLVSYSKKNSDGMALSVTGEWGSGKSTLMSYISHAVEKEAADLFKIISFNPWLFYKNEGIKEAFLIHLALALKDFETSTTKISSKINDFLRAFRWVKYISGTVGNMQEALENFTEQLSGKDSIYDIKDEIEAILKKSKKKILVLIDDVDRLSADQITELFQTITLVTNFSNIVYVVAFDRSIVANVLNQCFNEKGQEYLGKVFQVDYEIPSISDVKLEELFFLNMAELSAEHQLSLDISTLQSLWGYHGLKDYFKNIRDFKRFFNTVSFRLNSIADEVNLIDFLCIEAIRIFDYRAYEGFYKQFKLNFRKRELPDTGLTDEQFKQLNSPPATEIIKSMSPTSMFSRRREDGESKRLLDPAYFDRYFTLLREESDISEKDLRELIARSELRAQILENVLGFNRIENLLRRLGAPSFHKTYKDYEYDLISAIINFFNKHPDVFERYQDQASNLLIHLICGHPKKQKEFIQQFFQSFGALNCNSSVVHIYFFYFIRLFQNSDKVFRNDYPQFDDYYKQHYNLIEQLYVPHLKSAANFMWDYKKTKLCPEIKSYYLQVYAQVFPQEYGNLLTAFLNDPDFQLYLMSECVEVDTEKLILLRYDQTSVNALFPGETFSSFYQLIWDTEPESLSEFHRTVRSFFLQIDISEFPKINYPKEMKVLPSR